MKTLNIRNFSARLLILILSPGRWSEAVRYYVFRKPRVIDWSSRVEMLGVYSVIDTRHSPSEYDFVTKRQKEILYPLFLAELNGFEKNILDFGCGPGRFTGDLAAIINGEAIGVDPTSKLIENCPANINVSYICSSNFFECNQIKFDIVWICLVLGGIPDSEVSALAKKILNSLSDNGLLFIVEATGSRNIDGSWRIRTVKKIADFFPRLNLRLIGSYVDVGQEISILSGRVNKN